MKVKRHDIGLKELFRQKLEDAEITPSASFNARLMEALARKEFLHFNPAKFNVWYLGVILTAAITAGVLLVSEAKSRNKSDPGSQLLLIQQKQEGLHHFSIPSSTALRKTADDSAGTAKKDVTVENAPQKKEEQPATPADEKNQTLVLTGLEKTFSQPVLNSHPADTGLIENSTNEAVLFDPSVSSGCSPLQVHFKNKYPSEAKFSWIFGDGGYSDQKNPDWIFDREGEFRVVLNVYGSTGLISTYSSLITVFPKPVASFETSPDKAVIPDDEIMFLNYSTSALNYKWDFGDGTTSELFEPRHKYRKYGKFNVGLTINTEHGCSDTMVIADAFSGSGFFINMPNAFIPNPQGPTGGAYSSKTDENAEIFHPVFSGVADYQLRIFSKLGILIFESNDVYTGWDGYFKGEPANPGVYIWKIRGSFSNGEQFIKMGDVTLLKN